MFIAALDLGRRRIGLAICTDGGVGSLPLEAIERRSIRRDIDELKVRLAGYEIGRVIVGWPLNMDGTEGPGARMAATFAEHLRAASAWAVELFDERLSSFEAEERVKQMGGRRLRDKGAIDSIAACVILEGWMEQRRRAG